MMQWLNFSLVSSTSSSTIKSLMLSHVVLYWVIMFSTKSYLTHRIFGKNEIKLTYGSYVYFNCQTKLYYTHATWRNEIMLSQFLLRQLTNTNNDCCKYDRVTCFTSNPRTKRNRGYNKYLIRKKPGLDCIAQ